MATRIEVMDLLRGMAILGVVIGHISAETLYEKITLPGLFFNQLIRFAVPVFIFLSGLGLSLSRKPRLSYSHFIWDRLRKLMPLYTFWSFVYLIVGDSTAQPLTLERAGLALISGGAAYHLYFIPLILQFYLVFPYLEQYFRRTSGLLVALAITLALQFAKIYLPLPVPWVYFIDQRNFLGWLFYFALGIWCGPRLPLVERWAKQRETLLFFLLLPALGGLTIEALLYLKQGWGLNLALTQMRPSVLLYSLVVGLWVWASSPWPAGVKSCLAFLARLSYDLFLIHVFVLTLFTRFYLSTGQKRATLLYGCSALVVVLAGSLFLALTERGLVKRYGRGRKGD